MIQALFAVGGFVVGAALAYSIAIARSSTRTEAVAERRAAEREDRVRAEADQRIADLKDQQEVLKDQFRALAADALTASQHQFLDMADERFKRTAVQHDAELAKREEAVKQMVEPVSKALDDVRRQTTEAERLRSEGQATLREQVSHMVAASDRLDKKTTAFINTLRRSDVRGNWGQVALERVVELAGLREHADFSLQHTVTDDDGKSLRPDLIVHLPGGREVIVDAKVSWSALLETFDTDDEEVKAASFAAHAAQVKKHVDDLASKKYWAQFATAPDFVVMFLPSEAFFQLAVENNTSLLEDAFEKNVVIATPTTLTAMLRTVALAWKEDSLAQNARHVLDAGQTLHRRLLAMGEHFAKLGRALETAGNAYDSVVGSYERSVLPSSRRLAELKVVDKAIEAPKALDLHTRSMRTIESGPDAIGSDEEPPVGELDSGDTETNL